MGNSQEKARVRRITTKRELIENIIKVWHRDMDVARMCVNLVKSMPERISMLIQNKGMHTKF